MPEITTTISPGSRWRLRRGQHKGSIVIIQGQTFAGQVQYRNVGKGASVGSSSEDDEGRKFTRRQSEFLTLYEPVNGARAATEVANGAVVTQPRFRQKNTPKQAAAAEGTPLARAEGLSVDLMTITPDLAEAWLERGGVNRHLSEPRVDKLVAAIRRGEWQITGDTVKLDEEGKVRDGQHRLAAIAKSGVAVQALVVRGVVEKAFDVMDTGRSRSVADVLSIHGYRNIYGLQAAVRNLMLLEGTGRVVETTRESRELVTTASALEYVQQHPDVEEGVRLGDTVRLVMAGGHGLWAAMLTLFLRIDKDATYEFQDKLVNGEGLHRGNPILVLRNRLLAELRQYVTRNPTEKEQLAATIIRAWNLWRRNELVESWGKLSWKPGGREPFPTPD